MKVNLPRGYLKLLLLPHFLLEPLGQRTAELLHPATAQAHQVVMLNIRFSLVMMVLLAQMMFIHQAKLLEKLKSAIYRGQADLGVALPRRQIKLTGIYVARLLLDKSQQQQPLTSSAASGTIQNVVFRIFVLNTNDNYLQQHYSRMAAELSSRTAAPQISVGTTKYENIDTSPPAPLLQERGVERNLGDNPQTPTREARPLWTLRYFRWGFHKGRLPQVYGKGLGVSPVVL